MIRLLNRAFPTLLQATGSNPHYRKFCRGEISNSCHSAAILQLGGGGTIDQAKRSRRAQYGLQYVIPLHLPLRAQSILLARFHIKYQVHRRPAQTFVMRRTSLYRRQRSLKGGSTATTATETTVHVQRVAL